MRITFILIFTIIFNYYSLAQDYKNYIVPFNENCTSTGFYFDHGDFIVPCLYSGNKSSLIVFDTNISNINYKEYDSIDISFRPLSNLGSKKLLYGKDRTQSNDLRYYLLNDDYSIYKKTITESPQFIFPVYTSSINDKVYNGFIFDLEDGAIRRFGIQKVDTDGNIEFSKQYNSEIELSYLWSMAISNDNNLLLSAGIHYFDQFGRYSQITKLDTDGNEIWKYEGTEPFNNGATPAWITQLSDSSIVLSYEIDKFGDADFFLAGYSRYPTRLKWFSNDGEPLHEILVTSTRPDALHFSQIESGLSDYFFAYGDYRVSDTNDHYGLITKYSNSGDTIWTHRYRHPDFTIESISHRIVDLIEMDNGDIVVLGTIHPPNEKQEIWIFKINEHGCFGESGCNEIVTDVKDNELESAYVSLSPNPTTGFIDIPKELAKYNHISVFDQMGQKQMIIEQVQNQINISEFSAGIYFIRFQSDDMDQNEVFAKIIKVDR